jgi:hypothetical protein
LEIPVHEAFDKYLKELPNRVTSEFAKATPVLEFLRTGASVFNPERWNKHGTSTHAKRDEAIQVKGATA